MAKTTTDLYRSVMDKTFKIKPQVYPGDGVLYPRWEVQHKELPDGSIRTINKDVDLEVTSEGVAVLPGGGTSLHDIAARFNCQDFFIPAGTEYSDEIHIKADKKTKEHPRRKGEFGRHYQLEPKSRMLVVTFKGYLDNMARAAVARQVELAKAHG